MDSRLLPLPNHLQICKPGRVPQRILGWSTTFLSRHNLTLSNRNSSTKLIILNKWSLVIFRRCWKIKVQKLTNLNPNLILFPNKWVAPNLKRSYWTNMRCRRNNPREGTLKQYHLITKPLIQVTAIFPPFPMLTTLQTYSMKKKRIKWEVRVRVISDLRLSLISTQCKAVRISWRAHMGQGCTRFQRHNKNTKLRKKIW